MRSVSVTIIARDGAETIGAAIASAAWADEVVVLDGGSEDGTPEVAASCDAVVHAEQWRGYGPQRNHAAELARCRWILALDADECVDENLERSIRGLPEEPEAAAFSFRRRNYFAHRPIRHWPWAWDVVTRLYDRDRARFSPRLVHESLVVDGPVARIGGTVEHQTYHDWPDYLARQKLYAELGSAQLRADGRRSLPGDTIAHPLASFLRHWVARGWLLNGRLGFRLALESARGARLKYTLLRHSRPRNPESADE